MLVFTVSCFTVNKKAQKIGSRISPLTGSERVTQKYS